MPLEPARIVQSADSQPSAPTGQVAPPPASQGSVGAPGVFQQQAPVSQPASTPQQNVVQPAPTQAAAPPSVDPSQYERERQARLRADAELSQYRQAMQQFQQQAQTAQETQRFNEKLRMVTATANSLPATEAETYLQNQLASIVGEVRLSNQQQMQQMQQQAYQQQRTLAAPLYADHLLSENGLPTELKDRFLRLTGSDPDRMYEAIGDFKADYEERQAELNQYRGNQTQLARTQEVTAMTQAGLGAFGGQTAGGSYQIEVSDDPDEAALQILHHLRSQERGQGYTPPFVPGMPSGGD